MDVTQLPALTRILESRVEDKNHLDKLQKEVESAAHENRKLQLTIISPNSTSETPTQALERTQSSSSSSSGVKLQILFLKNLKEYHSTTLYSETQSATLASDFSSKLGNYLKDHPLISSYSPLISFQHDTPSLYNDTRIYNLRGNETIQITELTASNKGFIYGMILYRQTDEIEDYITPLHVKRGLSIQNKTALAKMKYIVGDLTGMSVDSGVKHFTPSSKIWINVKDLPWDETKLTSLPTTSRRNLEEKEPNIFQKVGFFLSEKLLSKKNLKKMKEMETPPNERKLQLTDFDNAVFNESIFWEHTLPNPNVTEYTFFYVTTDQRANDWTEFSEVKKIQFSLYGYMEYNTRAGLLNAKSFIALLSLLVYIIWME